MKRHWYVGAAVFLIAVAAWLWLFRTSTAPEPRRAPISVLLVTIDTLRADRVSEHLTPNLFRFAREGTTFTNARAAVPLTLPSHTTIMTGILPPQHGVHDNGVRFDGRVPTLARRFKDAGYRTGAFVGAFVLNRVFGLADGFDTYDDRVHRDPNQGEQLEAERRGGEVVDAALAWLEQEKEQRFFLWVHLYDPHLPYDPPPEYLAQARGNAYDGEVAYADAQVGRLLDALRDRNVAVVIAGDHGEGLGDHGEQAHGMLAYDSTLRVPLMFGGGQARIDRPVSLAGLAGTLLTRAGVGAPQGLPTLDDTSAESYSETEYPRTAGWHALTALTADRWKLILSSEPELYDVVTDAAEQHNVAAEKASTVDAMSRRLRELATPVASGVSRKSGASVPPEAAERLRALGYVGGSATATPDSDKAPNPARHIAAWTTFEQALAEVNAGRASAALPALKRLAGDYPDARVFQATYARALKDTGSARAAVDVYRKAVARWPSDASLYHDLGVAARAAGDAREAMRAEQAAIVLEGSNAAALNGLGLLQIEQGDAANAAASFEKATTADPSNASFWTNLGNARRELGDIDRAEQAYRRALEVDATYPDASNGLGVILVQRKRAAEAIPFFKAAVARDPRLYEAQLNLGIALQESGDPAAAAEAYRRVLTLAPPASREYQAATQLLKRRP
ncbi:MAG TPA: sulfatase-like hydrolase/transferase [Vicinamibacterales bacterium]